MQGLIRVSGAFIAVMVLMAAGGSDPWIDHVAAAETPAKANDLRRAESELLAALDLFEEGSDFRDERLRVTLHRLALLHEDQGFHNQAADYLRREVEVMRQARIEPRMQINTLSDLASAYEAAGDYEKALDARLEVLRYSETTSLFVRAEALRNLAELYAKQGMQRAAQQYFDRSVDLSKLDGSYAGLRTGVETLRAYAAFLLSTDEHERAEYLSQCADRIEAEVDEVEKGDACVPSRVGCSEASASIRLDCENGGS